LRERVMKALTEAGVMSDWFLWCDTAFRIAPPLIITEEQVEESALIILEALDTIPMNIFG